MSVRTLKVTAITLMTAAALSSCASGTPNKDADDPEGQGGLILDCGDSQPLGISLDIPGPGRATPELAVEPYADGAEVVAAPASGGKATVHAVREGQVVRKFNTTEHEDGWWPDGYLECIRR